MTAAFHHPQHHSPLGTALLLQAELRRLERYPARFGGVSVTLLCDHIRQRLQALEAGEPAPNLFVRRTDHGRLGESRGQPITSHTVSVPL